MRVLVSGCCGFIGSHLTEALLRQSHIEVLGVDNMNDYYDPAVKRAHLARLERSPRFAFAQEDMVTSRCIETWRPHVVYHLASLAGVRNSLRDPAAYVKNNVEAFVNVLQQAVEASVQKVFYASSSSVYGNGAARPCSEADPTPACKSPYAASKLAMETFAKTYNDLYGLTCAGFRFFTVYGPRGRPDMAPYKFLRAIHSSEPIDQYGDGASTRDYTFVDDIVDGLLRAMHRAPAGRCEVYNLGQSRPVRLMDFISTCERVVGKTAVVRRSPEQPGDVRHTHADTRKAREHLGFEARTSLEEGLTRMYESYRREWTPGERRGNRSPVRPH